MTFINNSKVTFIKSDVSSFRACFALAEKILTECCGNSNNSCGCYCKDFTLQIKRIEDEMQLLQDRMKHGSTAVSSSNNNILLRRENVRLQSDLESAKSAIKQLETKVNELQSEKSSLITVIRLLQEDNQQQSHHSDENNTVNQEDNPWAVTKKPKRKKKKNACHQRKIARCIKISCRHSVRRAKCD